jgi:hypothetical protein
MRPFYLELLDIIKIQQVHFPAPSLWPPLHYVQQGAASQGAWRVCCLSLEAHGCWRFVCSLRLTHVQKLFCCIR